MIYAEMVDIVDNKIAPKNCAKKLRNNECLLYINKNKIRRVESYRDHVIGVAQELNKLMYSLFRHRITRMIERLRKALNINLSEEEVIEAVALSTILHDHGKVYRVYQKGLNPLYRHEVVSSAFLYKLLKHKLGLNAIIASHLSLAVLLHHQPRVYRLLEDFNQYLITQSMLLEMFRMSTDKDFELGVNEREEIVNIIEGALSILSLFSKTLINEVTEYLLAYSPRINDVIKDTIIIQSIHVGLPDARIRRLLRFFTAVTNHIIVVCDNITAYKNRSKEPECVRKCGSTLGAIFSLIYG